jgi:hypothetical protein
VERFDPPARQDPRKQQIYLAIAQPVTLRDHAVAHPAKALRVHRQYLSVRDLPAAAHPNLETVFAFHLHFNLVSKNARKLLRLIL